MVQYEKMIINALLDSYENSVLFTGESKVKRNILFCFNKKTIPAYFDESSLEYEKIHILVKQLSNMGFLKIVWHKGKENHILNKVILNTDKLSEIYAYVSREPKADLLKQNVELLEGLKEKYDTPVCEALITYLLNRIQKNLSVKEYIDIKNIEATKRLLKGIYAVEKNERQCYIREFSIEIFHDSKFFECALNKIVKIFRNFGTGFMEKDGTDILAEYGIYHTPNYVYLKGRLSICIKEHCFFLSDLQQGLGISGEDIANIHFSDFSAIRRVMTIENLTTFFRWSEPDSLIIYLGGYHNSVRRDLLKTVHRCLPAVEYYHFGDIDAGGFEIYRDLCEKTQIPFKMYHMDLETLKKYQDYGKKLEGNDRKRLLKIQEKVLENENDKKDKDLAELIQYMLDYNVKLEQECVDVQKDGL